MNQMQRLQAINVAIWIRDNADTLHREELMIKIRELSAYRLFSDRQIARLVKNKISHSVISRNTRKSDRTGGLVPPEALEDILTVLLSKDRGEIDYEALQRALAAGTSQNMLSKLTGVSQPLISRRFGNAAKTRNK